MSKNNLKNNKGFTIIETMIAISLFIVVVTFGMQTLLNANLVHNKLQNTRAIMDSLSFTLEDMSRNIRTGYSYHCVDNSTTTLPSASTLSSPLSCPNGWVISFTASDGNQWVYYFDSAKNAIVKSTNAGSGPYFQITPSGVKIDFSASGFSVLGAEPPPGDTQQPFVNIRLVGTITYQNTITPFSLETAVSQRLIDR
jgi:type II secretory pathway pseudopilin PulG